jgi:transcriptional regulator with XRE-family HTH domain
VNTSRMPSKVGIEIRRARQAKGLSLRELARRVRKSPAYLVALEVAESPPGILEETLRSVAAELDLSPDALAALAGKMPNAARPRTETDISLYRLIRNLPESRKESLLRQLQRETRKRRSKECP